MWSFAFSKRNNNSPGVFPRGREVRVHRRVEKLERVLRVKLRPAFAIRIHSIDKDGVVIRTVVSSNDPALGVPYRKIDDVRKEAE